MPSALTADADQRGGALTRCVASGCLTLGGVECQEACHAEMHLTLVAPCLVVALADWLIGAEALLGQWHDQVVDSVKADLKRNTDWRRCRARASRWWLDAVGQIVADDCSDEVQLTFSGVVAAVE